MRNFCTDHLGDIYGNPTSKDNQIIIKGQSNYYERIVARDIKGLHRIRPYPVGQHKDIIIIKCYAFGVLY